MGFTSTRSRTRNSAAPRAVLNFLFLVRELVLVNPDNALQECCNPLSTTVVTYQYKHCLNLQGIMGSNYNYC